MNQQQAIQTIKDTFGNTFDEKRFTFFIKNLLNRIDESTLSYHGQYIPDAFKQYIKSMKRVGKFYDDNNTVDILVIHLEKESSLERARTMQRNYVAWYLNGSRPGGGLKDAALVAYVAPGKEDWRFSLVKMEYKFDENGKVKEDFTPARRWSFLVGANENSHTAQSRLVDMLADDENNPTLEEIEKRFDIETVTNEFFLKYRELFLRTKESLDEIVTQNPRVKEEFENKNVDTVNFAKKLLGQLVFLYFLQKKGWFGVGRDDDWGSGSQHFMRELFEKQHSDYQNFFNDILEPLFYEALRIDRSHDDDYYSRFNCKIPFLNGGLFDPINNYDWVHTDIKLPNDLFSNNNITREGDIGDGILDIFDRYNFTVKEDEPLEKDVAIDPELLGKAYEKFNAIRPDNFEEFKATIKNGKRGSETKFNKKFGVYYTPREIVHYMCRQSLLYYLSNELNQGTVAYSKLGNGNMDMYGNAYKDGQLDLTSEYRGNKPHISREDLETLLNRGEEISHNEAVAIDKRKQVETGEINSSKYQSQLPESIRQNAELIDQKLAEITVCDPAVGSGAFPVGMMNEIVRARNVLSVFLDDTTRNDYEFKRRCIEHSLYGVDIDPGAVEIAKLRLWLSLVVDETDIQNIKPLPNLDYRIMQGNSLISEFMGVKFEEEENPATLEVKDEVDDKIQNLNNLKREYLNESGVNAKAKLQTQIEQVLIEIFESRLKKQKAEYFNRLNEIDRKYAALPNEEQRRQAAHEEKEKLYNKFGFNLESAEQQLKEFSSGKQVKPFFLWKLYFAEVFHQKHGFDVVIANPPYVQLQKNSGVLGKSYKDAGYKSFAQTGDIYALFYEKGLNILKNNGVLTFITSNKWMRAGYGKNLRKLFNEYNPRLLIDLGPGIFETATVDTNILVIEKKGNQDQLEAVKLDSEAENYGLADFVKKNKSSLPKMGEDAWFIGTDTERKLKEKIEQIGTPLKDWDVNIYRGILTGYNEAFIIDEDKRNELIQKDPNSEEIIKPILRGRDIKRYGYDWKGLYLIATHNGYKDNDGTKIPPVDIKHYPAVKEHLDQYWSKIFKRQDQGCTPYNLRDCSYFAELTKSKVVYPETTLGPNFYCDKNGTWIIDKTAFF